MQEVHDHSQVKITTKGGHIVLEIEVVPRRWRLLLDPRAATHLVLALREAIREIHGQDEESTELPSL